MRAKVSPVVQLADELHRARDQLRRTIERYEASLDELRAINEELTRRNRELEAVLRQTDRRTDELLATLSHELRNPLTPLRVAAEILNLTDDAEQAAQSREIIERQVGLLTQLVDELLDLSRITQGKIELHRDVLDPARVVEAALETMGPLIRDRGHELQVTLPHESVRVLGDLGRLVQVVSNLLSNAATYTPECGRITLELAADAERSVLAIRVRDNGVGIPANMLTQIFDIFVQGRDSDGRAHGGLGIGLNLVRRLVELHGGTVAASSGGEGRGSEFTVELPLST